MHSIIQHNVKLFIIEIIFLHFYILLAHTNTVHIHS